MMFNNAILLLCFLLGQFIGASTADALEHRAALWNREIAPEVGRSRTGEGSLAIDNNRGGVMFIGDKRLLVYGVEHDPGQLSSRQDPDTSSPFRLRAWLFDSESGELRAAREWGTRAHDSAIQVTSGGVLVRTGTGLRLCSVDLTDRPYVWRPAKEHGFVVSSVSSTGNTVLVNQIDQESNTSQFATLDGNTLKVTRSWEESPPLYGHYANSDNGIAAASSNGHSVIFSRFGDAKWNTLASVSSGGCYIAQPAILADDSILIGECKNLFLLSVLGVRQFIATTEGRQSDKVAFSSDGRFLAISLDRLALKKHLLTEATVRVIATRVEVYDLKLKKCVFAQDVSPVPNRNYDFALSPDGLKLAILNDGKVSMYSLSN